MSEPPHAALLLPAQGVLQEESGSLADKELRKGPHQHSSPYSRPAYWALPQSEAHIVGVMPLFDVGCEAFDVSVPCLQL